MKEIREITATTYDLPYSMEFIGNQFGLLIYDNVTIWLGELKPYVCFAVYCALLKNVTPERNDDGEQVLYSLLGSLLSTGYRSNERTFWRLVWWSAWSGAG